MCRACFEGQFPQKLFAVKPVAAQSPCARASRYPRKVDKGKWAMAIARLHPQCGISGTGHRDPGLERSRGKFSQAYLLWARVVLRRSPELAARVTRGSITLSQAYATLRKTHPRVDLEPYQHVEGTKTQRAMALALRFPGYTGESREFEVRKYIASGGFSVRTFRLARLVLRNSPRLAEAVLRGDVSLNAARAEARRLRMLQSAGRFRMQQYRAPRSAF
jgi:hypothetical protein